MYVIQKFRCVISVCKEAVLQGRPGGRNEKTAEDFQRRDRFWTKLGCVVDYDKSRIEGDLKQILANPRPLDLQIKNQNLP